MAFLLVAACTSAFLALVLSLGIPTSSIPASSWDFTGTLGSEVALTNTVSSATGIELDQSSGTYVDEGYIDISVTESTVSGLLLQMEAEPANLVANNGFEDSGTEIKLVYPLARLYDPDGGDFASTTTNCDPCVSGSGTCPSRCSHVGTGFWFTDNLPGHIPTLLTESTDTDGDGVAENSNTSAKAGKVGDLAQIVKLGPGEDVLLSWYMDLSNLVSLVDEDGLEVDQELRVWVTPLDANMNRIPYTSPGVGSTVYKHLVASYKKAQLVPEPGSDDWRGFGHIKFQTIACEDYLLYEGGSVITASDLSRNPCEDSLATALTMTDPIDGTSYTLTSSNFEYIMLEFDVTEPTGYWSYDPTGTGSYAYALIDDVRLEPIRQLEWQLLDGSGTQILSSYLQHGAYVDSSTVAGSGVSTLRIVMRSFDGMSSPVVTRAKVLEGLDVEVEVGDTIATITEPRFEIVDNVPPKSEFNPGTGYTEIPLRSQCIDFADGTAMDCFALFRKYGIDRMMPQYVGTDDVVLD